MRKWHTSDPGCAECVERGWVIKRYKKHYLCGAANNAELSQTQYTDKPCPKCKPKEKEGER